MDSAFDRTLVVLWGVLFVVFLAFLASTRVPQASPEIVASLLGLVLLGVTAWRIVVRTGSPGWLVPAFFVISMGTLHLSVWRGWMAMPEDGAFPSTVAATFLLSLGAALKPVAAAVWRRRRVPRRPRRPPPVSQ